METLLLLRFCTIAFPVPIASPKTDNGAFTVHSNVVPEILADSWILVCVEEQIVSAIGLANT